MMADFAFWALALAMLLPVLGGVIACCCGDVPSCEICETTEVELVIDGVANDGSACCGDVNGTFVLPYLDTQGDGSCRFRLLHPIVSASPCNGLTASITVLVRQGSPSNYSLSFTIQIASSDCFFLWQIFGQKIALGAGLIPCDSTVHEMVDYIPTSCGISDTPCDTSAATATIELL